MSSPSNSDSNDQTPHKPVNQAPTTTRTPEMAGRSGNWEEYQKPRAFHRAPTFIALLFLRLGAWAGAVFCAINVTQAFLAKGPDQRGFYKLALVGLVSYLVLRLFGYLQERSLRCSLCHGTPLHDKSCRKHRKAVKLPLVGYSGSILLSALFTGKFRCSYCGTPFRLKK